MRHLKATPEILAFFPRLDPQTQLYQLSWKQQRGYIMIYPKITDIDGGSWITNWSLPQLVINARPHLGMRISITHLSKDLRLQLEHQISPDRSVVFSVFTSTSHDLWMVYIFVYHVSHWSAEKSVVLDACSLKFRWYPHSIVVWRVWYRLRTVQQSRFISFFWLPHLHFAV